jgi:hypothetical protein
MRMSCARPAAVVVVLTAGGFALGASSPAVSVPGGGREARAAGAAAAGPTVSLPVPGNLDGVAARSAGNAWAVGQTSSDSADSDRPILAHWNGRIWRTVSSPALPARGGLNAVATFPGGGWAVGQSGVLVHGGVPRNLIVRLAGTTARRMPIRGPADGELFGVAATSAANAWAVGGDDSPLILHWNGTVWKQAPLPSSLRVGVFRGVAATSRTNAWAVMGPASIGRPRIVHWNGRRWGQVVSPDIGQRYELVSVAATSATNAWAVGFTGTERAVILHWDGRRWKRVPSPNPDDLLFAVTASSADNAWAVGVTFAGGTLALHWNGHFWKQVKTPDAGLHSSLDGLCFIPPSRQAWAVGDSAPPVATLILHWNGTAWH